MLEIKQLEFHYTGASAPAMHFDLNVDPGEVVSLVGPSGSGKSTLLGLVSGFLAPDSGQILLNDDPIDHLPMQHRAKMGIGYLPQEASVFRKLTVADNIMAILETRKINKQERKNRLQELLDELQVEHIRDNLGISLSGGERRRVEIARALAAEPQFILLDEPFAGVDPLSVLEIQKIVSHLTEKGIGVLITDHNVRETLGICNRAYIIGNGRTLAEGPPDAILQNQKVRDVYLGDQFRM